MSRGLYQYRAHGFTIEVIGDPERVTKTLAAIDFAKAAEVLD